MFRTDCGVIDRRDKATGLQFGCLLKYAVKTVSPEIIKARNHIRRLVEISRDFSSSRTASSRYLRPPCPVPLQEGHSSLLL